MTRHRFASAPALAVALAAASLFASVILGLGASAAHAAPERHAAASPSFAVASPSFAAVSPVGAATGPSVAAASGSAKTTKPFPVGFIIGGVLVVIGFAGGVYGQMLRRRGRRPPGF
jgi:hypothetical protein